MPVPAPVIENFADGEVVPTPTFPAGVMKIVEVPKVVLVLEK